VFNVEDFTARQVYEIAYKLRRLPECTEKMLDRKIKPSKLNSCKCVVCDVIFMYTSDRKKTCSVKRGDVYTERLESGFYG